MTRISNMLIPALIFYIVAMGLSQKKDIYASFTRGAKDGMRTVAGIVPTLIGLMIAVGVLRASGFLEFAGGLIGHVITLFSDSFPNELISLFVVKLFSASAATGLALDIFKEYGTDSFAGLATSLALASTETVFYTMSVYFMAARVTKTKWTLAGGAFVHVFGACGERDPGGFSGMSRLCIFMNFLALFIMILIKRPIGTILLIDKKTGGSRRICTDPGLPAIV